MGLVKSTACTSLLLSIQSLQERGWISLEDLGWRSITRALGPGHSPLSSYCYYGKLPNCQLHTPAWVHSTRTVLTWPQDASLRLEYSLHANLHGARDAFGKKNGFAAYTSSSEGTKVTEDRGLSQIFKSTQTAGSFTCTSSPGKTSYKINYKSTKSTYFAGCCLPFPLVRFPVMDRLRGRTMVLTSKYHAATHPGLKSWGCRAQNGRVTNDSRVLMILLQKDAWRGPQALSCQHLQCWGSAGFLGSRWSPRVALN